MVVRPATTREWIRKQPRCQVIQLHTVTDPAHVRVGEDLVLVPVDQVPNLVDVGWGETVGVGLVVGQLSVDVVVDIPLSKKSQSERVRTLLSRREDSRCSPK
jgi:hypothetical protein